MHTAKRCAFFIDCFVLYAFTDNGKFVRNSVRRVFVSLFDSEDGGVLLMLVRLDFDIFVLVMKTVDGGNHFFLVAVPFRDQF